jgi:hypothetical protein
MLPYCTPGDLAASGSSLLLPRAPADTRGQHSTLHYTGASIVHYCYARAAEGGAGAGEEEGRGNGGRGEGSRSDCWWYSAVKRQELG